jgi:hypothetical protein
MFCNLDQLDFSKVVVCIEKAVRGYRVNPTEFPGRVEALRNKINAPPLTDDMLRLAKKEGRP